MYAQTSRVNTLSLKPSDGLHYSISKNSRCTLNTAKSTSVQVKPAKSLDVAKWKCGHLSHWADWGPCSSCLFLHSVLFFFCFHFCWHFCSILVRVLNESWLVRRPLEKHKGLGSLCYSWSIVAVLQCTNWLWQLSTVDTQLQFACCLTRISPKG